MARPSIPVDVVGNTSQLRKQIEELSRTPLIVNVQAATGGKGLAGVAGSVTQIGSGLTAGTVAATSFNKPLGRISGNISEIDKSLGAANARVIAFGASASAIFAVESAVKGLFTSFVNTEKQLASINTVLNLDKKGLKSFGKDLYKTAGQTGQSFDTASEAALEFSRQGLGVEETANRTRQALILSRLSGLDAASSVDAITASINSYKKEGLSASQVVNKLANVDAGFAVSSGDLAEALTRVGSSASDAGVSFDELIALVTSAQQTTARGGAVIGNSLKTIFTRLGRTQTREMLGGLGISLVDEQGNEKNQIALLKDLSSVYGTLGTEQKNAVAEQVGGVFQLNILKAALSDLGKSYSVYDRALNTSLGTTDQAEKRNAQLNKTLSGLGTETMANVQSAASTVGEGLFAPAAKNVLNITNAIAQSVNTSDSASIGSQLGQGIINGLGSFLSGPGLAVVGAVLAKLFGDFSKYGATAAQSLLGLDSAAKNQAAIQQSVAGFLQKNAGLYGSIVSGQTSATSAAKQYLQVITQQTAALQQQSAIVKSVSQAAMAGAGASGRSAMPMVVAPPPAPKTKSSGFIPNFASQRDLYQQIENVGASQHKGGYNAGLLKSVTIHDGMGGSERAYMTSRESKKTWMNSDGYKATMITPPNGFGPNTMVASNGFIPNFGPLYKKGMNPTALVSAAKEKGISPSQEDWGQMYPISEKPKANAPKPMTGYGAKQEEGYTLKNLGNLSQYPNGVSLVHASKGPVKAVSGEVRYSQSALQKMGIKARSGRIYRAEILTSGIDDTVVKGAIPDTKSRVEQALTSIANDFGRSLGLTKTLSASSIPNKGSVISAAGTAFEQALSGFIERETKRSEGARVDFADPSNLRKFFHNIPGMYEAKQNVNPDTVKSAIAKFIAVQGQDQDAIAGITASQKNQEAMSAKQQQEMSLAQSIYDSPFASSKDKASAKKRLGLSSGFIPNFGQIQDRALNTEKSYGKGAVLDEYRGMQYVRQPGQSSNFRTMIKQDHPEGLGQAIRNSAVSQGLSRGFIPNFAPEDNNGTPGLASIIQSLGLAAVYSATQRSQISSSIKEEGKKEIRVRQENRKQLAIESKKQEFEQRRAPVIQKLQTLRTLRDKGLMGQTYFEGERKKLATQLKLMGNDFKSATASVNSSFERLVVRTDRLVDEGKIGTGTGAKVKGFAKSFGTPSGLYALSSIAPIIGETIAGELGKETVGGRTVSAAAQGVSWAATGMSIAGPWGAAAGGIVGAFQTYREYIKSTNSLVSQTSKDAEAASAKASRTADLAQTVGTSISDYYQTVNDQGAGSIKAQKQQQQILADLTKFGSENTKALTKAFLEGGDIYGELGKVTSVQASEADKKAAINTIEQYSSEIRGAQADAIAAGWNILTGNVPKPTDQQIKDIGDAYRKLQFGDASGKQLIDAVDNAGGYGKMINAVNNSRDSLKEFKDVVREAYGDESLDFTGALRTAKNFVQIDSQYIRDEVKSAAQKYLDALDKETEDAWNSFGKETGLTKENFKTTFGALFQNPETYQKIIQQGIEAPLIDAREALKNQAQVINEFKTDPLAQQIKRGAQDIESGVGISGIDLMQKSFQNRLSGMTEKANKVQDAFGEYASTLFPEVFSGIEEEQKKQEKAAKRVEAVRFYKSFGLEPPADLMQTVMQDALKGMSDQMYNLGIDPSSFTPDTQNRMVTAMGAKTLMDLGYKQPEVEQLLKEYQTGQYMSSVMDFTNKQRANTGQKPYTPEEFSSLKQEEVNNLKRQYDQYLTGYVPSNALPQPVVPSNIPVTNNQVNAPTPVTPPGATNIPAVQPWMMGTNAPIGVPQPPTALMPTTLPPEVSQTSQSFSQLNTDINQASQAFANFGRNMGGQGTNAGQAPGVGAGQGPAVAQGNAQQNIKLSLDGKLPEPKIQIGDVRIDVTSLNNVEALLSQINNKIKQPATDLGQRILAVETALRALEIKITRNV